MSEKPHDKNHGQNEIKKYVPNEGRELNAERQRRSQQNSERIQGTDTTIRSKDTVKPPPTDE
jgi:hypothetical protein